MRSWPLFVGSWVLAGGALVISLRARPSSAAPPAVAATEPAPSSTPTQVVYLVGSRTETPLPLASASAAAPIDAPPPPKSSAEREQNARIEREEVVGRLQASGTSAEPWTRDALATVSAWEHRPELEGATFSRVECHRDGCLVTASYADADAEHRVDERLPATDEFQRWPGAKFRSGPEHAANGGVSTTWVFYRPE